MALCGIVKHRWKRQKALFSAKWHFVELYFIKGLTSSLSATNAENQQIAKQTPSFTPKNVKLGVLYYINEVRYSYFRDCVLLIKFIQSHNN